MLKCSTSYRISDELRDYIASHGSASFITGCVLIIHHEFLQREAESIGKAYERLGGGKIQEYQLKDKRLDPDWLRGEPLYRLEKTRRETLMDIIESLAKSHHTNSSGQVELNIEKAREILRNPDPF